MIPQGYKQTEIGVIPEEWKIASLKDLSDGQFTYGVNAPAIPYAPPLPNYIRITDISDDGRFIRESRTSVDCQNPEMYTLKENDIVFARTGASTGKTYLYRKSDGDLVYAGFLIKASILPEKANSKYVFDNLHTNRYWDWVSVTSMRSGQPGINGNEYASYMIPCPSLLEQEHIAEALSDVDSMISALEKLIAKKKAIKQGTMQELLTGKKRLPGFVGEWDRHKLGEYVDCVRGVSYNGSNDVFGSESNQTIRLLRSNNIQDAKFDSNDVQYIRRNIVRDNQILKTYDIMICMANGSKQLVGKNCIFTEALNEKYTFGAFMSCLRAKKADTNMNYIFELLNSTQYWNNIALLLSGSSINNLRPDNILEMEFKFPSIAEQTAIASILTDMDNEIEVLEQKLSKTRQIKQGMMQQLLTGKIRLV